VAEEDPAHATTGHFARDGKATSKTLEPDSLRVLARWIRDKLQAVLRG
jgi:hypothetical protein